MPSSYGENSAYFQSVNNVHNCLLSLSSAGVEVERVQIKPTGTLVKVRNASELEQLMEVNTTNKGGIDYKQTDLFGCTVIWEAA